MAGVVLEVVLGNAAGTRIPIDGELVIGRASSGPGQLGGDGEISRRHARIAADARGTLWLEDLGSTNGTFVDDAQVTEPQALMPGDVVRLGQTTLEVRAAPDGASQPSPTGGSGQADEGRGPVVSADEPTVPRDEPDGRPEPGSGGIVTPAPAAPVEQIGSPSSIRRPMPALGEAPPPADVLHAGRRVPIMPQGLSIGRSEDCDIVISSPSASPKHSYIGTSQGRYYVADLETVNGTHLNGERLRGSSRWLNAGDTVTVGGETLRFLTGQATQLGGAQMPVLGAQLVRFDGERLRIGRDSTNDMALDDPNVSRFHAEVVAREDGLELRDLGSRNGTRVNGSPVTRARLETGSEVGIGPFRLVFDGSDFLARDDRGALRLGAREITVAVQGKVILNRASIDIEPGEFVVIIGESGSGKSTLVKALAGVNDPTKGVVTVNGEPVAGRLTDIGYVPQDEIVHGDLTVVEALRYSAKLRLPKDSTRADIAAAVSRVLEELSLTEHGNTRIRSLSGGQRKRAGMAAELLNRPSLLFLDEPTTGLDPALETRMMELFDELSDEGTRAVAVVTHATKNLSRADKVCVLKRGGDIAFYGLPEEALAFFEVETFDDIYPALEKRSALDWRRRFEAMRELEPPTARSAAAAPAVPEQAGARPKRPRTGRQASVLTARYLRLFTRDRRNLAILLGQVPVIALGVALLFQAGVLDPPGQGDPLDAAQLLFLLVTTAIWLGSIDGSREIIKERALAVREAAVGVKHGAYLLSKALVLAGVVAIQVILLAAVVFAIRPLNEPIGTYALVLALLMLTGFVSMGVGLLVSASVNTEDQATSFIPLVLIPQLLFAGAIVPVKSMGVVIEALSNLVFARWAFASTGSAIDMNERIEADAQASAASKFGGTFFDLPLSTGIIVLLCFLVLFFMAVLFMLHRRRA